MEPSLPDSTSDTGRSRRRGGALRVRVTPEEGEAFVISGRRASLRAFRVTARLSPPFRQAENAMTAVTAADTTPSSMLSYCRYSEPG